MTDLISLIKRLRATALDNDNCPRMDSEKACTVWLALQAADELERLAERVRELEGMNTTACEMRDMALKIAGVNKKLAEEQHARAEVAYSRLASVQGEWPIKPAGLPERSQMNAVTESDTSRPER